MTGNPGSEAAVAYPFRSVDAGIALEHGVPAAFVHHQIGRWCAYNKAEGIDAVLIDGAHWMYISHERLQAALPWYNVRTIRRAIETLNRAQLLHKRLRKGTDTERSGSPAALLYRAIKYVGAGVDKMSRGGGQNVQVGGGQNVHVEYVNLEQEKKSADLKDQTTSAKARSKEAAVSRESVKATSKTATTREHTPRSTRSTDGFKPIDQVFDVNVKPPKKTQPPPLKPKPLSPEQIRINQEALAARALEEENRLIPELRNLVKHYLARRIVTQPIRHMMEIGVEEDFHDSDEWYPDLLRDWVKQLQAMRTKQAKPGKTKKPQPHPQPAAEAAG